MATNSSGNVDPPLLLRKDSWTTRKTIEQTCNIGAIRMLLSKSCCSIYLLAPLPQCEKGSMQLQHDPASVGNAQL